MGLAFTETAHTAMAQAKEEAARLNHIQLGTEHLLLGILSTGGDAIRLLAKLGADPDRVCTVIEEQFPARAKGGGNECRGQSPLLREVIARAREEADQEGRDRVGTMDLLRSILSEKSGGAAIVLKQLGIDGSGLDR